MVQRVLFKPSGDLIQQHLRKVSDINRRKPARRIRDLIR